VPDLFSAKPVVVKGRYKQGGTTTITLKGKTGSGAFERKIEVDLPKKAPENEVLASLWARAKVDDLMSQDMLGVQRGNPDPAMKETVLGLGLRYQLLTQFTSFVAVEHLKITEGGEARTVAVPVEMPEGVSYEGVFGTRGVAALARSRASGVRMANRRSAMFKQIGGSAPAAPAPAPAAKPASPNGGPGGDGAKAESQDDGVSKLAAELQGLAEKVAKEGSNGNLTVGKVKVTKGRVEVRVQLTSLADESLAKLKQLGLKILAEAKSAKLVIATVEVSKLEELAKLDVVVRVEPS
jgi:Ca-activated chloride channel family protein